MISEGDRWKGALARAFTRTFLPAPQEADIVVFNGKSREELLRISACLEENFPHSIANAVVNEAKKQGLVHQEMHSHLYLAIGGVLEAVICIEDPLREEADAVINTLRRQGITKIVMMTGDSERTARAIAAKVGADEYYSEVLPENKARFNG